MQIILAKTAGFCFGVDRAVELTESSWTRGIPWRRWGRSSITCRSGRMEARGVVTADTPADVPAGYELVIRSHGIPRNIVYDEIAARGLTVHDATCPFVRKFTVLPNRRKKRAWCLSSRATQAIPRCRELLDIHKDRSPTRNGRPRWQRCR